MSKVIYYAHSVGIYGSEQEKRDIELLKSLGFVVVNPNESWIEDNVRAAKAKDPDNIMKVFDGILDKCDGLAFRSHPDMKIGRGVWYEINYIRNQNKFIIELPNLISTRALSLEDTREYLKILGNR